MRSAYLPSLPSFGPVQGGGDDDRDQRVARSQPLALHAQPHRVRGAPVAAALMKHLHGLALGAIEVLDRVLQRLEQGELSAVDAIDQLLLEEYTARLAPIKTLESFDFTFQPSLDRHRILALAQLEFVAARARCP